MWNISDTIKLEISEGHNIATSTTVFEGDEWVVVKFSLDGQKGIRKFIGQILRVNDDNTFLITFVRLKSTEKCSGYVYTFPNIPDEEVCMESQIVEKLCPPKKFQRGLQFSINAYDL